MSATLQRHAIGLTWIEPGMMVRSAHALHSEGRVWLVDPFDDGPALREAESLGTPAGVFQLLDRHNRDCEAIASRLGVPLLRLPPSRATRRSSRCRSCRGGAGTRWRCGGSASER